MIRYSIFSNLDDMDRVAKLQQIYWGANTQGPVPAHMLYTIYHAGGHVIAALHGEMLIGVLVGLPGIDTESEASSLEERFLIYSKRLFVLPEYRGQGIAVQLKFLQCDLTLKQGIRHIRWTFDPMLSPNARLNLRKLGGTCVVFKENYYGTTRCEGLVTLGSSDRLVLDWRLNSAPVKDRIDGSYQFETVEGYIKQGAKFVLEFDEIDAEASASLILTEIPLNFIQLVKENEFLAQKWQRHNRKVLKYYLNHAYSVIDFVQGHFENKLRGFYVLSRI